MDCDDFRSMLESTNTDVWDIIDTAITVASMDYGDELKVRRDSIVEKLYSGLSSQCRNCSHSGADNDDETRKYVEKEVFGGEGGSGSRETEYDDEDGADGDGEGKYGSSGVDDEQSMILEIKERLEDVEQSEEVVVDLLQSLADMDITFKALKETDIGRHVNRLRKHPSNEVKRLVKYLVRKWKDLVDEWVRANSNAGAVPTSHLIVAEGDSPLQKPYQNGHHQEPDFGYSPHNHSHNGSSGFAKNSARQEYKAKPTSGCETPTQRMPPNHALSYPSPNRPKPKDDPLEAERLLSARKRLQANYKEAENAKKQRTIQMMDIHEIPKPKNKNTFFAKNKGGSHGGRHW